jgi:hypothetical protein
MNMHGSCHVHVHVHQACISFAPVLAHGQRQSPRFAMFCQQLVDRNMVPDHQPACAVAVAVAASNATH